MLLHCAVFISNDGHSERLLFQAPNPTSVSATQTFGKAPQKLRDSYRGFEAAMPNAKDKKVVRVVKTRSLPTDYTGDVRLKLVVIVVSNKRKGHTFSGAANVMLQGTE